MASAAIILEEPDQQPRKSQVSTNESGALAMSYTQVYKQMERLGKRVDRRISDTSQLKSDINV